MRRLCSVLIGYVALFLTLIVVVVQGNAQVFYDPVYFATPGWPHVVVTEDFDRDGDFDLAVMNSYGVAIFIGGGDGTFTSTRNAAETTAKTTTRISIRA